MNSEDIKPQDLSISSYREPNKGQWDQNPDRGITIKHIPSGITTACHSERSSHANRAKAMAELSEKLKDWNGVVAPSLKQQLQVSQEENAALKVQVNELRAGFGNLIIACNNPTANFGIDLQMAEDCLSQIDEQSLAAHDNEVIEKCAKVVEQRGEEIGGAIQPSITAKAIRNLKTEGE